MFCCICFLEEVVPYVSGHFRRESSVGSLGFGCILCKRADLCRGRGEMEEMLKYIYHGNVWLNVLYAQIDA